MSKFELGRLLATRAVADRMETDSDFATFVNASLKRYIEGDWGEMAEEDKKSNDEAVQVGDLRIFAAYINSDNNEKIWIITEADRSATTILYPSEY